MHVVRRQTTKPLNGALLRWGLGALTAAVAACGHAPTTIVHARLASGRPLAGLSVEALPFDPDRLLDSLERVAPRPKPRFPTLEQTLLHYHRPRPGATLSGPAAVWLATRDSVNALGDSLTHLGRRSPAYASAFGRYRQLYQRMVERQRSTDGGRVAIPDEDRRLADRVGAAADSLRAWEDVAYAAYPALTQTLMSRTGRQVMRAETDSTGTASLALAPGSWWLIARLSDQDNPFVERVWRLPVTASAGRTLVVPIFEGNYTVTWRH